MVVSPPHSGARQGHWLQAQRFDYIGFVAVTWQLKQRRSPAQQQAIVAKVFDLLMPPTVSPLIRRFGRPTHRVGEGNAWFATRLTAWLVGASDRYWVEVLLADNSRQWQQSKNAVTWPSANA
ncbi:MAG TPA: hypothetical protein IGP91_05720 [Thermosynechococcus sp. M46_R2017_013]|nr:hypothetical protein [Thermosynechococcus sp. M46_R2017_013]